MTGWFCPGCECIPRHPFHHGMREKLSPSSNGRQGYTTRRKFGNLMGGGLCGFHNGLGLSWSFAIPLVDRLDRRPGAVECILPPGAASAHPQQSHFERCGGSPDCVGPRRTTSVSTTLLPRLPGRSEWSSSARRRAARCHAPGADGHGAACRAIQHSPGFTSSTLRPGPSSRLTVPRISADKIEI